MSMEYYNQNGTAVSGAQFCAAPGTDPRFSLAAIPQHVYNQALAANPHTLPPGATMMLANSIPAQLTQAGHPHMIITAQPLEQGQHQQPQQSQQMPMPVALTPVSVTKEQPTTSSQSIQTITVEGVGSSFVTPQNIHTPLVAPKAEQHLDGACEQQQQQQQAEGAQQQVVLTPISAKAKVKKRSPGGSSGGIKGSKNVIPPVSQLTGDHLETFHAYKEICDTHVRLNSTTSCQICDKQFAHWGGLQRHLQSHANFRPYVCKLCGKTFHCQSKMKRHEGTHTGVKPHKCPLCDVRVSRREHLKRHLLTHSESKPYSCSACGYSETPGVPAPGHPASCPMPWPWKPKDPTEGQVEGIDPSLPQETQQELIKWKLVRSDPSEQYKSQEVRELPGGKFGLVQAVTPKTEGSNEADVMMRLECDVSSDEDMDEDDKDIVRVTSLDGSCKDPFDTFHKLCMDHMVQKSMSLCLICKRDLQQWMLLRKHLQKHAGCRPYTCVQCGRGFYSKDKMLRHFKTHSGLKPYRCLVCGKEVSRAEHLRRHQLTHSEDKPYECVICNYRSRRNDSLRTHLKKAHRLLPEANQNLPLYIRTNFTKEEGMAGNNGAETPKSMDATSLAKSIVQGVVGTLSPKKKKKSKKKKKAEAADLMPSSSGSTVNTNQVLALTKSLSGQQTSEAMVLHDRASNLTPVGTSVASHQPQQLVVVPSHCLPSSVHPMQMTTKVLDATSFTQHQDFSQPQSQQQQQQQQQQPMQLPVSLSQSAQPRMTPTPQAPMTPQPPMTPTPQPPMTPNPHPMTPHPQHMAEQQQQQQQPQLQQQQSQQHSQPNTSMEAKAISMFLSPAPLPSHFQTSQPSIKFSEFSNFTTGAVSFATAPGVVARPMFAEAVIPNGGQIQVNRLPPMPPNAHPMFRPPLNQFYG